MDTTGQPLNCSTCLSEKGIFSLEEALPISDLMGDNNPFLLSNFPPLSEASLHEQVRKASKLERKDDEFLQSIDNFFSDLQNEIEKAINIAKNESK